MRPNSRLAFLRYFGFFTLFSSLALLLLLRLCYLYISDVERFPIHSIKIAAVYQAVTPEEVGRIFSQYLNTSFFVFPVRKLYADLMKLDGIREVGIERIWPDTLNVRLVEKIPIAYWNHALLTERGELLKEVKGNVLVLPHLIGPENQQLEVLQIYKKMSKILASYGLSLSHLEQRNNQAFELTLMNGVVLRLGKNDIEKRLLRFCKLNHDIFSKKQAQLASVDLRYPKAIAVQWKN